VILAAAQLGSGRQAQAAEDSLAELRTLAESAGAAILTAHLQVRERPEPATLIGQGKVEEIAAEVAALRADAVIFDNELTPTQVRNLSKALDCRVIDRTQLILDIFASRARTREGQLQVELAQLQYLLPRLTGMGSALSRLGGGIGTRGPGETKLEMDRRKIGRRIKKLSDDLEQVRATRHLHRKQRQDVPLATISLAGYTNAGKSTLFNRLTGAGVLADSKMFATLDPTVRQVVLPSRRPVLLSDTVGFIRNLPTTLVKAFRATLEEVSEAMLILHVVDAASPEASAQTAHVMEVLGEIGAGETPQVLVLNKADALEPGTDADELGQRILGQAAVEGAKNPPIVLASGRTGLNVDAILAKIDELLTLDAPSRRRVTFPAGEGAVLSMLHRRGKVESVAYQDNICEVEVLAPASLVERLAGMPRVSVEVLG
jgi:GTP-binding protein HflX